MFHLSTPRLGARAPFGVAAFLASLPTVVLAFAGALAFAPGPAAPPAVRRPEVRLAAETPAPTPLAAVAPEEVTCLAKAVYYEARGESADGQAAVAQVVINRTRRPAYPRSVCAVVFQGGRAGACQFSFVCNGAMDRPLEPRAWTNARQVASRALGGHVMRAVGQAISFHVAPLGSGRVGEIARIGGHVFFALERRSSRPSPRAVDEVAEARIAGSQGVDASAVAPDDATD